MTLVILNGKDTKAFIDGLAEAQPMNPPTDGDRAFIDALVSTMTPAQLSYIATGLALLKDAMGEEEHLHTVCKWADMCETKNPNFDRERFYKASGVDIPPPAGEK